MRHSLKRLSKHRKFIFDGLRVRPAYLSDRIEPEIFTSWQARMLRNWHSLAIFVSSSYFSDRRREGRH